MKKDGQWYFFVAGLSGEGRRQQGEGGTPPIKGRAGLIGSAARYEYVHSPGEHKNKFSLHSPNIHAKWKKTRDCITNKKQEYISPL